MERAGLLVDKQEFLGRLWPDTVVEEAALAENISRLRRALGDGDGQRLIATVPKRGYRFEAPVRVVDAAPVTIGPAAAATAADERLATARRLWPLLAVAGFALVAITSTLVATRARRAAATPPGTIHSLAVLPFENLSHDPEQEYFADGMTDELLTHLAHIGALRVISRTSVMRFKGARRPLSEIAGELGVDAVVAGTVLRSPQHLRVTVQLIQARPEKSLWAESYDRAPDDVVALQGDLARDIAHRIAVRLTPREESRLGDARAVPGEAHEAFLQGRFFWAKRTEEGTRRAVEFFQRAVDRDPQYAEAYTGLADSYISLALAEALQEVVPPREAFPRARAAADRALALDEGLGAAHASLAHIKFQYDRDWAGAEREFQRALDLDPGYANAHHWYGLSLLWSRRPEEARAALERARALDPLSLVINANLGLALAGAGRYDEAAAQCRRTLEMDPGFALGHYRLAQVEMLRGRADEAVPQLEQAITLSGGSPRALAELGAAQALRGHAAEARAQLAALEAAARGRYVSPFDRAVVYAALGEREPALQWLEKAEEERAPSLSVVRVSPAFAGLAAEPRFVALTRRLGLDR